MMKVLVGYPSEEEEFVITERVTSVLDHADPVATPSQLLQLQDECRKGFVEPALMQYAVKLVAATREPSRYGIDDLDSYIAYGGSPRATIHLVEAARALGFLRGRAYVLPQDVVDVAPDVLRHRIVRTYDALADQVSTDQIIQRIMTQLRAPEAPMERHVELENA
jgi:MoxR-like ATPase